MRLMELLQDPTVGLTRGELAMLTLTSVRLSAADLFSPRLSSPSSRHRLVGLVVKASASRAEDPRFESRLRRDFFGVQSYQ